MIVRILLSFVKRLDQRLVRVSMHLVRLRYRKQHVIHPKHLFDPERNTYLASILERKDPGFSFLDLGCGAGSDLLLACESGAKSVYGIEVLSYSRQVATDRIKGFDIESSVVDSNLEDGELPFPDGSIDVINFTNVLEHIVNRQAVLQELERVLHDDGEALISIPNKDTPWKKLQRRYGMDSRDDIDHKIEYSEDGIHSEMEEAGLTITTPLSVIVPSLPIHGWLCLLCVFSPKAYLWGQNFKRRLVNKHPQHSIGWIFVVKKSSSC